MSKKDEALKLALEALEEVNKLSIGENAICLPAEIDTAMDAIRDALAEQPAQQEPVADEVRCPECGYLTKHTEHIGCLRKQLNAINAFEQRNFAIVNMDKFPPAQRTWVGLTDEEKSDIWCVVTNRDFVTEDTHVYADAIEAKLREKNNG